MFQNFLVKLLLHRDCGFNLQLDLAKLVEVQDGFVCVADLEILVDHSCDFPSREKAFFFCAASSRMKTLRLKAPLMIFLRPPRYFRIKNLEVCLQLGPGDRIRHLELGSRLRGFNLANPNDCLYRTTRTSKTRLLKFIRHMLKFLKSGQASNSSVSASCFWKTVSISTCSGSSTRTSELCVAVWVSPGHTVIFEL